MQQHTFRIGAALLVMASAIHALHLHDATASGDFAKDRFSDPSTQHHLTELGKLYSQGAWEIGKGVTFETNPVDPKYHWMSQIDNAKPVGQYHWQSKLHDTIPTDASLKDALADKHIFFLGDSYGREQYRALVTMLMREYGLPEEDKYAHLDLGSTVMNAANQTAFPLCDGDEPYTPTSQSFCPGLDTMDTCGDVGRDEWKSPDGRIKLSYTFKTYFWAPRSDDDTLALLAQRQPDLLFLDIGRWQEAPPYCNMHPSWYRQGHSDEELVRWLEKLNSTNFKKPVLMFQGREDQYHWECLDLPNVVEAIESTGIVKLPIQFVLNETVVQGLDMPMHHGCTGNLLYDVTNFAAHFINYMLK